MTGRKPLFFLPMRFALLFSFLLCFALPAGVQADGALQKEAQVIANLLKYIRGTSGESIGIVYDPSLPSTLREAEALLAQMPRKNKASLIAIDTLGQNAQLAIAVIPQGLQSHYASIAQHAQKHRMLTLGLDGTCAQQNTCVLSIDTSSGIEIFLNEDLLRRLGFDVDAALRFMVKRV